MDSSDSEDDCYGNIAQKLQSMKDKYTEDKIESTNLLNESAELDEIVKKANVNVTGNVKNGDAITGKNSDEVFIDNLIASSAKRVTRSNSKRKSDGAVVVENTAPKKSRGRKTNVESVETSSDANISCANILNNESCNRSVSRARGRGRGRNRGRSRNTRTSNISPYIPTYSVGNTDEYPDHSDSQALFATSNKTTTSDVVIIEENEFDENEELSVKVYWQSSDFYKFTIRKFQKLTQIFDYFSKKENVGKEKLFFTFNDKILSQDDTPETIDYSIVKFIDGGIINQSVVDLVTVKSKNVVVNGITLKFQCQNIKKPLELAVCLDEKLSIAMMKCAERLETSLDKLKFEFDGDVLSGKSTARELELEGGECIDVKIIS